jgi:uncharacterized protein (TIGR00251 family)
MAWGMTMETDESALPCLTVQRDGSVGIWIYVQPRASKSAIAGMHDGCLKLAITSPPVDNKANRAVTAFLADFLNIPRKNIRLISGDKSRRKLFGIAGSTLIELQERIMPIVLRG